MKILLAYQPTDEGRAALSAARDEAQLRGADLIIARHVKLSSGVAVPEVPAVRSASSDVRSGQDPEKLQAELDAVAQDARASGISAETRLLTTGSDPAKGFLEVADDEGVDLIVIGIRRRSPVGKLVLGSVSQDVLLQATCNVLAVKAPA